MLSSDLADMKASALWHLKAMVDSETAKGNDLMADMIRRLNRDIRHARQSQVRPLANPKRGVLKPGRVTVAAGKTKGRGRPGRSFQ